MNLSPQTTPTMTSKLRTICQIGLLTVGATTQVLLTHAQSVLGSDPAPTPPAAIPYSSDPSTSVSPSTISPAIQWGQIALRPRFSYLVLYGDGVIVIPGQKASTMQIISAGIQLNLGTHWSLDYSPTETLYSNANFNDNLSHLLSLTGRVGYGNWQFQLTQTYTKSADILVQTARQTEQKSYNTSVSASYRFGPRMQLDSTVGQNVLTINNQAATATVPSTRTQFISERLSYIFTPRINANVSFDTGYSEVNPGSDMSYTRPQLQIAWRPTDKISLNVQGGSEFRKIRSTPARNLTIPTYSSTLIYRPFTDTQLTFLTVSEISPSYVSGQVPKNFRWNIILDQQLFQYLHLHTGYAEEENNYVRTDNSTAAARTEKIYLYNLRFSTTVFRKVGLTALYQHRTVNSSDTSIKFSGSYVGFQVDYRY